MSNNRVTSSKTKEFLKVRYEPEVIGFRSRTSGFDFIPKIVKFSKYHGFESKDLLISVKPLLCKALPVFKITSGLNTIFTFNEIKFSSPFRKAIYQ